MRTLWPGLIALLPACDPAVSDDGHTDPPVESDPVETDPVDTVPADTVVDDTEGPTGCPGVLPPPRRAQGGTVAFDVVPFLDRQVECVVVDDLDRDGHVDVATIEGDEHAGGLAVEVWYGTATARQFDAVRVSVPDAIGNNTACSARDLDHDGDLDLLYGTVGGVAALIADGRTYTSGGSRGRFPRTAPNPDGLVLWLAQLDLDGKGDLDLVAGLQGNANADGSSDECSTELEPGSTPQPDSLITGSLHCFVATADGRFERAPAAVCPEPMLPSPVLAPHGAAVLDLDDDGDGDLISLNDFGVNRVYLRDGRGLVLHDGTGLEVYNHAMGFASGDFDGDGTVDLYFADVDGDSTYLGDGCLSWFDAGRLAGTVQTNVGAVNWGSQALDLDADGALDLAVTTSVRIPGGMHGTVCDINDANYPLPPLEIFVNGGTGRFTMQEVPLGEGKGVWHPASLVRGDLDGDLDDDLVVSIDGRTFLAWNTSTRAGPVLRVRVVDANGGPAIGARVTVSVPEGARVHDLWPTQAWQGHSELTVPFAFGASEGPATVEVRWPDGHVTTHGPYAGDRQVTISP